MWGIVGGTSGAAPLAAAITADANEDAGQNLGFANPFIYGNFLVTDFNDILLGNNSNGTGSNWPADTGFDLVTGRGSLVANTFATKLASYIALAPTFDHTKLTGTHPLNRKRVNKGKVVDFTGKLTNTDNANSPIANRQIIVIGNGNIIGVDRTDANGVWDIHFKVKKRLSWHAIYMGSDVERPSLSPTLTVRIQH
ncbi:MAG: hypothetical protein ACRDQC_07595 [Gaiellales bacterium]